MVPSDIYLVEKHLSGEEAAFSELVKKHLKPIYGFVFRFVHDRDIAEDLTQETFLKVWKNLNKFDRKKNFRTWIYAIAKNTTFDWLKKKKEFPFSAFSDEEGIDVFENIADDDALPDEITARSDVAERLEKILEKLPPPHRAILLLRYKEEFSLHEIAEILDESYNTVKSRHQRGLSKLKTLLSGQQS